MTKLDEKDGIETCPEALKLMVYLENRHKALESLTLKVFKIMALPQKRFI